MKSSKQIKGLTLVELMVSIGIFAILAAGVSNTTMMTSRIAYGNVYENTAYMVAQGYAEQIKSIRYDVIRAALDNPSSNDIPTQSLSLGTAASSESLEQADPLIFGVPVVKDVVVDIEDKEGTGESERIMSMWITARGSALSDSTNCWDAIEIILDFEWEVFGINGSDRKEGSVRLVKTNVSEF